MQLLLDKDCKRAMDQGVKQLQNQPLTKRPTSGSVYSVCTRGQGFMLPGMQ